MDPVAPTTDRSASRQSWSAVTSIAVGTFVMVTSEFLPIGLLGSMAQDLGVAPGTAGLMVSIPGVLAAVTAPAITAWSGSTDRRRLLVGLTLAIAIADVVVASAGSLPIVLLGRALLGIAVGGFWAFAAAAGRRLVKDEDGNKATALILGGISIGTVLGVPIGTWLGDLAGWRATFAAAATAAFAVTVAQAVLVPKLRGNTYTGLVSILEIARDRRALLGFAATALVAAGHFAAYTYLEPFLNDGVGASSHGITGILAAYGLSGVLGTWLGERAAAYDVGRAFACTATIIGIVVLAAGLLQPGFEAACALIAVWGMAFGAVPVCVQIWTYQAAPKRFETGSALIVTVFQLALAAGAFAGGRVVDAHGVDAAFVLGGGLALAAAGVMILAVRARN